MDKSDPLVRIRDLRVSFRIDRHSVFEAVFLSQRVLVMGSRPGRVLAEVRIDAPYPRHAAFRTAAGYAQACAEITQALESAQATA